MKRYPTLHIVADNIPEAHYRAIKKVATMGAEVRTEYDRKDSTGNYIDPPSRDARVLIEVINPFSQPRYPINSHCEIGTYIAEIMGVKDNMVVPQDELIKSKTSGALAALEWPYTYHQRLFAHPDGVEVLNQIDKAVDRLAESIYSRRAVASTAVPTLDPFLKEDIPCLREVQMRLLKDDDGKIYLNLNTFWRSRDLYKAWADNVVAITFMQQYLCKLLSEKLGEEVIPGSYADYSGSLHIYGQDMAHVYGEGTMKGFLDLTEEDYMRTALDSECAADMLVIPQLEGLLSEQNIRQWKFGPQEINTVEFLIDSIKSGVYMA